MILILLGGLGLFPGDQTGIFVLGTGLILLGINLLRLINGIAISRFSLAFGAVAAILGGWASLRFFLGARGELELPLFPIILIAAGVYVLIPSPEQERAD
jgi:hypothetical protein